MLKNEKKIKDEIKQLETLYVNEIQLSLGEEFKSDSLKENKENLEKDIKKIIEEVYLLKSKNKDNKLRLSELNQNLKILKKHNENKQQDLIKKKKALKKYEEKNVKLDKEITSNLDKIEILSLQYKEIQTEIKTLGEIAIENQLSDSSIVNLIKIKKGFENSVYAALNHELDATLKNSKKRWVKTEFQKLTEIQNPLSNFVEGPNELLLILSQIGFVDDDSRALELQKNLSVGQILVNKEGTIWRWDGFISEDNLQKKKLLDSNLRVKELSSKEKLIQKQLSDLEKIKVRQINEKENNAKNLLAVNTSIESLYQEIDNLTPEISKSNEQKSIIQLNIENTINKMSQLNKILENSNKKLEEVKISESASFKNNKNSTNDVQNKISELDQNLESVRNQINLLKQKIMRGELNKTYYENDLLKSKKIFEETSKKF